MVEDLTGILAICDEEKGLGPEHAAGYPTSTAWVHGNVKLKTWLRGSKGGVGT